MFSVDLLVLKVFLSSDNAQKNLSVSCYREYEWTRMNAVADDENVLEI